MHSHSIAQWTHGHAFLGEHHSKHERRTWSVVILTACMMVAEIAGGTLFGSIALIADGWHMAIHVAALAIAGLAYLFARRHALDVRFSLGTGKFGELAAFASAMILGTVALGIGYESVLRLLDPVPIRYREAIPIAILGLCVNLASAWLLRDEHDHDHDHSSHAHGGHHPIPICVRPTFTCLPTRSFRYWRLPGYPPRGRSAGPSWTRWSGW
jgi:Co/Zn/Cd efflux system component